MYFGHTISNADRTSYKTEHSGSPPFDVWGMVAIPNSVQLTFLMLTWPFTRGGLQQCQGLEKENFSSIANQEAIKMGTLKYTLIVPRSSGYWQPFSMALIMQYIVMCKKNSNSETSKLKCSTVFYQAIHRAIIWVKTRGTVSPIYRLTFGNGSKFPTWSRHIGRIEGEKK